MVWVCFRKSATKSPACPWVWEAEPRRGAHEGKGLGGVALEAGAITVF